MFKTEQFNAVVERMHLRYETIFSLFRPSRKGVGFTEVNLTHNFMLSLKEELKKSELIEWLEFPWTHNGSKRIDGIVVSKKDKWIMYIEAKRFQEEKQVKKLNSDLLEIENFCRSKKFSQILKDNHNIDAIKSYRHYMVALADVWTEKDLPNWKKKLPSLWMDYAELSNVFPTCEMLTGLLKDGMNYVKQSSIHTEYHQLYALKEFEIA